MYLLYLDDAGSPQNRDEDYFVLGGVSVFERQVHWLARELDLLAESVDPANSQATEFHASAIFGGRNAPWSSMRSKDERRNIIKSVLRTLERSHPSTRAFACAVHKASFPGRDPIEIAFEQLCSRFDLQLKRIYSTENDPQRGLLILDESSHETTLQQMARDFRSLGTRWGVLRNIVDVPLFVDSRASRLVQLADHVAYAVFRRYQAGDTSYLDPILSRFDAEEGRLHGLVHMQTIDPQCMCPACMSRR
jgi:hypothetical protein